MTIQIVNGYTCETTCDVAKAKAGQDPHPRITADARGTVGTERASSSDPAVVFGGSLADSRQTPDASAQVSASSPTRPGAIVDVSA